MTQSAKEELIRIMEAVALKMAGNGRSPKEFPSLAAQAILASGPVKALVDAALATQVFLRNGIALGYIQMPTVKNDPANSLPDLVDKAIAPFLPDSKTPPPHECMKAYGSKNAATEQERFEQEHAKLFSFHISYMRNDSGEYADVHHRLAFKLWQAAKADAAQHLFGMTEKEIVEMMAEEMCDEAERNGDIDGIPFRDAEILMRAVYRALLNAQKARKE